MRTLRGNVSTTGYRRDSKDKDNDFNIIPSNKISMKGVDHDVIGVSDTGDTKVMKPGKVYRFGGKSVLEVPMYQGGGRANLPQRFRNTTMYPTDEIAYDAFYDSPEFKAMSAEADRDTEQTPMRVTRSQDPVPVQAAKAGMDTTAFIRGIAGVESDLNYRAQNPTSSAVGAHQFLWDQLKNDPMLKGVSKEQYMANEDLQNRVMKAALTQSVAGGNPYDQDIKALREEYAPQIPGFDERFSDEDLLLMRHLKGRQGAREYLGYTVRDDKPENLKGTNMTFPDYQEKFYRYYRD